MLNVSHKLSNLQFDPKMINLQYIYSINQNEIIYSKSKGFDKNIQWIELKGISKLYKLLTKLIPNNPPQLRTLLVPFKSKIT